MVPSYFLQYMWCRKGAEGENWSKKYIKFTSCSKKIHIFARSKMLTCG